MTKSFKTIVTAGLGYLASVTHLKASTLAQLTETSTGAAGLINGAGGYSVLAAGSIIGMFVALRTGNIMAICSAIAVIIGVVFGFDMLAERFSVGDAG